MIIINNKKVIDVPNKIIGVYVNGFMVWPELDDIFSCFAKGYWINLYPWTDTFDWKNI